jgi:hypothetical protein
MKCFSILTLALVISLTISACGAKATPPPAVSAVDMQNTAAAVALTMYAQTQAAVPTATPIPPTATFTNTPLPTNTFLPLPAAGVTSTPVPNSNSGGGEDCVHKVLPDGLQGNPVKIRINNSTKVSVNVTVYLNRTIPPVVCGYRGYVLDPGGALVINDMVEGCFTLWAWNPDPKGYFMVTNGAASCIDSSDPVAFDISTSSIKRR